MRRLRAQSGQSAAEYVGLLLLVATIIGALATSGIPGRVADAVQGALCDIAGTGCPAEASPPERVTGAPPPGDADGDRVSDRRERALGLDPHTADSDGDGLPDGQELTLGADARNPDTDGDGLDDAEEADSGGAMRPNDADSDDDGLSDAEELAAGTDPAEADPDGGGGQLGDGLTDAEEIAHGTDPNAFDTDGDGYSDGYEVEHGRDPTRDERNIVQKGFDLFLDDPFTLGKGALIKGGAKKIVDGVLSKGGKAVRKIGEAKSIKEAARIRRERINAWRYRMRGAPQGMTREQFGRLGATVRAKAGHLGDDIRVHGSRASGAARADSDVDIAIRVPAERFDELMRQAFKSPNPGSQRAKTMQHAAQVGKIRTRDAKLHHVRDELKEQLGMDVDLSVIRIGGEFDRGPWVPVP